MTVVYFDDNQLQGPFAMSLFAILCSNSEQRRRIEALLLSTKLPIAKDGQDGVTHVLVADRTLPLELKSNYPDAEIDLAQLMQSL